MMVFTYGFVGEKAQRLHIVLRHRRHHRRRVHQANKNVNGIENIVECIVEIEISTLNISGQLLKTFFWIL